MPTKKLLIASFAILTFGGLAMLWNQKEAARQRDAILAADKQGKVSTTQIVTLREFTTAHMNASVSFELTASYQRALEAAQAASQPQTNNQAYVQAESACRQSQGNPMVNAKCIADYVAANTKPGENPQPPKLPSRTDYIYRYKSPGWTPDLAGLTLLTGAAGLIWVGWKKYI